MLDCGHDQQLTGRSLKFHGLIRMLWLKLRLKASICCRRNALRCREKIVQWKATHGYCHSSKPKINCYKVSLGSCCQLDCNDCKKIINSSTNCMLNYFIIFRWFSKTLLKYSQDDARSSLRPSRQSRHIVRHENPSALRVRETSAWNRVGREHTWRQNQRNLLAAHLMSSVPSLSALLPAQHGSVQGQISRCFGKRLETSLAFNEDYANKLKMPRGIISKRLNLGWRKD